MLIYTDSISTSAAANLYAADYTAFENNTQYNTPANIPTYDMNVLTTFTPAASGKKVKINLSDYIKELGGGGHNIGFRIDIPSSNKNHAWKIGSCNNGLPAPELKFVYSGGTAYEAHKCAEVNHYRYQIYIDATVNQFSPFLKRLEIINLGSFCLIIE